MQATIGMIVHYFRPGDDELAGIVVHISAPNDVTIVYWSNTGVHSVRQSCPYCAPGNQPPKTDYCTPAESSGAPAPGVTPAKKP